MTKEQAHVGAVRDGKQVSVKAADATLLARNPGNQVLITEHTN